MSEHYEIDGLDVVFTPWHSEYMDEDFVAVAVFRDGREVYHAGMTYLRPSKEQAREIVAAMIEVEKRLEMRRYGGQ